VDGIIILACFVLHIVGSVIHNVIVRALSAIIVLRLAGVSSPSHELMICVRSDWISWPRMMLTCVKFLLRELVRGWTAVIHAVAWSPLRRRTAATGSRIKIHNAQREIRSRESADASTITRYVADILNSRS